MKRAAYVDSEVFRRYRFSAEHPLNPARLDLTRHLLEASGLLEQALVIEPRPASREELLLVHDVGFVDSVAEMSADPAPRPRQDLGFDNVDNVPFQGMFEAASARVGGSIEALEAVLGGRAEVSFNPGGGFHHADRARASGFCIFNDVAIVLRKCASDGLRAAYIDIDGHHADGVQRILFEEGRVLKVSIHESGRTLFPGTGFEDEIGVGEGLGRTVNLPLAPGSGDDIYLELFGEVVSPVVRAFGPDLLVVQIGCDAHFADPLTNLRMTTRGYEALVRDILNLTHESRLGKLVALGGGGYNLGVVPRCWGLAFAAFCQKELTEVPPEVIEHAARLGVKLGAIHDPQTTASTAAARSEKEAMLVRLKRHLFPVWGVP